MNLTKLNLCNYRSPPLSPILSRWIHLTLRILLLFFPSIPTKDEQPSFTPTPTHTVVQHWQVTHSSWDLWLNLPSSASQEYDLKHRVKLETRKYTQIFRMKGMKWLGTGEVTLASLPATLTVNLEAMWCPRSWCEHRYASNLKKLTIDPVELSPTVVTPLHKNLPAFYGTEKFITTFLKAHYWSLPWATWTLPTASLHIPFRSISILSSHLCLCIPSALFSSAFPTKILYALLVFHASYMHYKG
jgi:hypothetical protein